MDVVRNLSRYLPLLIIIAGACFAWYFGLNKYLTFEAFKNHRAILELYIANHYVLSVLIFAVVYVLVVSMSIPVATFMTVAGGFLFGQIIGTTIVVISATLGACILFFSASLASHDLLLKKAGARVKKMQKGFQENALSYLITLRLIPLFPFVLVNLAAAVFQIPLRTFFIATLVGIIPGSFVYVSMGVALKEVTYKTGLTPDLIVDPKIIAAFVGLGVLSLAPVLYKYFQKKRAK